MWRDCLVRHMLEISKNWSPTRRSMKSVGLPRRTGEAIQIPEFLRGCGNIAISDLMKIRRAGAVVIAAWILLAPSIDCARRGLEKETPLSDWENVDSFSSYQSCEDYRATVIDTEKNDQSNLYAERYSYSICLSADDPRLKEK